jgi:hypothetical protein
LAWRWPWQKRSEPIKPPKVAGTRAPNRVLSVGFDRPHDYHFHFQESGEPLVFRRCTLVGFTTPIEDPHDVPSYGEAQYDRWLVLKRPDGRLVYVPRNALRYIEESVDD